MSSSLFKNISAEFDKLGSMDAMEQLKEFIIRRRDELHLSQRDLGKMSGLHHGTVAAIEAGRVAKSPSMDTLQKLAKGLRVDEDTLIRIVRGASPGEPAPRPKMDDAEAQAFLDTFETLSPEARKVAMDHLLFLKHRDKAKE